MHNSNLDHEYAGITGLPNFCKSAIGLALGDDNPVLKDGLVSCFILILNMNIKEFGSSAKILIYVFIPFLYMKSIIVLVA